MCKDTELLRLEQFVEKLLQKFSDLRNERDALLQTVAEKESAIAGHEQTIAERDATIGEKDGIINARDEKIVELEIELDTKNDERNEISSKVSSIMEQIESWELSLDDGENVHQSEGEGQGGEEHHHQDGEEHGEGRIQHDLF